MKAQEASGLKLPVYKYKIYRSESVNEQNILNIEDQQVFIFIFLPLKCFCGYFYPLHKTSQKYNDVQAFGSFFFFWLFIQYLA